MTYPILAAGGSVSALAVFGLYVFGVFVLAWFANKLLSEREFLSEYFLGSRSLGTWAFALTYAATSASGGSFTGFPSKIYSHGWILAVWIASYMVVPICSMGIFGKRINQVARKSGAITVPDVLRDRFDSRALGLLASLLIVFFISFNLVAQFKAGAVILKALINDVEVFQETAHAADQMISSMGGLTDSEGQPIDGAYLLCLMFFGITVIFYTTYGGFHAVVWTDVMQGIVMVLGVLIMLPLTLIAIGGLGNATREMADLQPPRPVLLCLARAAPAEDAHRVPSSSYVRLEQAAGEPPRIFRLSQNADIAAGAREVCEVKALEIVTPSVITRLLEGDYPAEFAAIQVSAVVDDAPYAYGASEGQEGAYVTGPGPDRTSERGFLPLGVAISFFFMWAISGAGQPQHMVRLMAFKDTRTLRQGIITVTLYYSAIYFPLIIIFCCARILLPGLDHQPDSVMPEMIVFLTKNFHVAWLAGLLIAAPFAAVMSTVDSFLLMISSGIVRDIYQRNINPDATEKQLKRLSYMVTLIVGTIALIGAINPPKFLQDIIVYVGSGLAACFLMPMASALFWPRSNKEGCLAGMIGGFLIHLSLYVAGIWVNGSFFRPMSVVSLDPVVIGLVASLLATYVGTMVTPPPPEHLVRKYFCKDGDQSDSSPSGTPS